MFSLSNWKHLLASVCSVIAILLLTSIAMNDSNRTTKESLPSSETLAIVQVTFYTAITIFGTIANLALCGTMIRKKQPRNASEYLILNLAFTDLMTCAVGIPLDVAVILFHLGLSAHSCAKLCGLSKLFLLQCLWEL